MTVAEPLRAEHAVLLPRVRALRVLADGIDGSTVADLLPELDEVNALLVNEILPHAMAEDRVLYPEIERIMAAPGATATMTLEHVEVERLTSKLTAIRDALAEGGPLLSGRRTELRRILYGLYELLKLHMTKEEAVYAPLLDSHLDEAAGRRLFEAMHEVELETRQAIDAFAEHETSA